MIKVINPTIAQKSGGGRLNYIDSVKGIALILVVFNHVSSGTFLNDFISSFHVPVFFFVTGYLLHIKRNCDINNFRKIIFPYCYFSIIAIIANCLWNFAFSGNAFSDLLSYVYRFITGYGILAIWFLSSYFVARVVFSKICKFPIAIRYIFVFMVIIASYLVEHLVVQNPYNVYLFYDSNVLYYLIVAIFRGLLSSVFVEAGYDFSCLINLILSKKRVVSLLISIILFCIDAFFVMHNDKNNFSIFSLGKFPLIIICGVVGSLGLVLFVYSILGNSNARCLHYLSKNSLVVMCTHMTLYLTTISLKIVSLIFVDNQAWTFHFALWFVRAIGATAIVVGAEVIITLIINRFFPFLLGLKTKIHKKENLEQYEKI